MIVKVLGMDSSRIQGLQGPPPTPLAVLSQPRTSEIVVVPRVPLLALVLIALFPPPEIVHPLSPFQPLLMISTTAHDPQIYISAPQLFLSPLYPHALCCLLLSILESSQSQEFYRWEFRVIPAFWSSRSKT